MKKSPSKLSTGRSTPSLLAPSGKSKKVPPTAALVAALTRVKDYMTDAQKALILLKEGKLCLEQNDVRGALDCFNEGITYNPTISLFNMRAQCHKLLDQYTEAYYDYSYNIRLEPEVGVHYCNRGLVLARLKKFTLAIEDFDLAMEYDKSASNYYARATVFAEFGRFSNAVDGKAT